MLRYAVLFPSGPLKSHYWILLEFFVVEENTILVFLLPYFMFNYVVIIFFFICIMYLQFLSEIIFE